MRSPTFSRRTSRVKASAIREILKVTERPDILSFAGGLPAPEAFPVEELARAHAEVFAREGAAALQYSTTEGFGPLRAWVAERMRRRGLSICVEQVLITSGSQQGIDLVARVLLDPGDPVVVESPSYLAALQVFEAHEASFVTVGSDEHGMRVDQLERALKRARPKLATRPAETQLIPAVRVLQDQAVAASARIAVDPHREIAAAIGKRAHGHGSVVKQMLA